MNFKKMTKILAGSCILLAPLTYADMDYLSSVSGKLTTQCSLDAAM